MHFFESRAERQQRDRLTRVQPVSTMSIEAYPVPEHARIEALPKHFGRHMLTVERRIYDFMSQFASAYSGGCWRFFELGNGGFYMSPSDAVMYAEAAHVVATLMEDAVDKLDPVQLRLVTEEAERAGTAEPTP